MNNPGPKPWWRLSNSKVLLLAFRVRSVEIEWSPLAPTGTFAISSPLRCIQLPVTTTAGVSAALLVDTYREQSRIGTSFG